MTFKDWENAVIAKVKQSIPEVEIFEFDGHTCFKTGDKVSRIVETEDGKAVIQHGYLVPNYIVPISLN